MPFQRSPSLGPILACVLAAGIVLTGAGCGHITPLGPDAGPPAATPHPVAAPGPVLHPPQHLRSPFVLQAARIVPPMRAGRCPAGTTVLSRVPGRYHRAFPGPRRVLPQTRHAGNGHLRIGLRGHLVPPRRGSTDS
jgi:hypothetical protein